MNRQPWLSSRRVVQTWTAAESLAASLTRPRTDLSASDAEFARLLETSSFVRAWRWLAATTGRAWSESRLRLTLDPVVQDVGRLDPTESIQMVGWMIAVAASIALMLQILEPTPVGPVSWLLPTSCIVGGMVLLAGAQAIAAWLRNRTS
jgi:hypothetical protein